MTTRAATILELQRLRLQLKRFIETREEHVLYMQDIMSVHGYQPLSLIAGAAFDASSEQVKSFDAYLPILQARIAELVDQALAQLEPIADKRPQKERKSRPEPIAKVQKPTHVPWREWSDAEEPVQYPVPITVTNVSTRDAYHVLSDDIDRRAKAVMSWAPWVRRARYRSRRYEGFGR